MRILLTNDDGIHAPGLRSMEKIARELTDDIWIVAPETDQSGASHSLTLNDPMRVRKVSDQHYAVKGTPTDCVIMGLKHIIQGAKPDLILSGVNRGQNIADDVTYSGTIAGAFEGSLLGIPSMALSQAWGLASMENTPWHIAEEFGASVIRNLLEKKFSTQTVLNINFPDCPREEIQGAMFTRQGKRDQNLLEVDERIDARGKRYYWFGFNRSRSNPAKGTDLWAVYNGYISITPLSLDLTDHAVLSNNGEGWPV